LVPAKEVIPYKAFLRSYLGMPISQDPGAPIPAPPQGMITNSAGFKKM